MGLPPHRRVHLDSSVYIAFLKREMIHAFRGMTRAVVARRIFEDAEAGRMSVFTSMVTLVEVRRGMDSRSIADQARIRSIDSLFNRSSTHFIDVDRALALSARRIANQYGISTMDAIQVASAVAAGCSELFIWDNRIVSKFSTNPIPGLSVREPYWEEQRDLPQ